MLVERRSQLACRILFVQYSSKNNAGIMYTGGQYGTVFVPALWERGLSVHDYCSPCSPFHHNRPFSYSKKESESNYVLQHFVEFSKALTPLDRALHIKMYENNARSRLFFRIAKRSIIIPGEGTSLWGKTGICASFG